MISDDYFEYVELHQRIFAQWKNEMQYCGYLQIMNYRGIGWYIDMSLRRQRKLHRALQRIDEELYLLSWVGA